MSHTPLSAHQLHDECPLGALIRFSGGAVEPPARHRRKHAAWRSSNGTGRLVRKAAQRRALPASFTLHVGDFGSRCARHMATGTPGSALSQASAVAAFNSTRKGRSA